MNKDKYGEVINGEKTYEEIVNKLKEGKSVIIGWTDENFSHYDILFNFNAYAEGTLQGGLRGQYLFISIMRWGAFGFKVSSDYKYETYIAEKLDMYGDTSIRKLTELINNVIKKLLEG